MMHLASEITLPYQINKKCFMEIALTDLQREVLVGILLGDAHLRTNRKRDKASLVVLQGDAHKPYVFHLYNIFKPLPSAAPRFYSFSDKRAPGKSYGRWSFQTPMLKCLAPYAESFYDKDNKKRVPLEIANMLSARGVAFWYMDDGAAKWKDKVRAVRFCCDSFSEADVLRLIDVLKNRFNIVGKLYKGTPRVVTSLEQSVLPKTKHRISIAASQYPLFTDLVFKHIHPSMVHKYPKGKAMLEEAGKSLAF